MKFNGWRLWLVSLLFFAAVVVTSLFVVRTVRHAWRLRAGGDEQIQSWMPVPYIARSHHVPPRRLFEAIGVRPGPPPDRRPIGEIAREQGRPVEELISRLNEAILRERQEGLSPTPPDYPKQGGAP